MNSLSRYWIWVCRSSLGILESSAVQGRLVAGNEVQPLKVDGYCGDATLGDSTTGHIDSPFVETSIVNPGTGGNKSMPIFYDNDGGFANNRSNKRMIQLRKRNPGFIRDQVS